MSEQCNQKGCDEAATHLYTWPGRDQAGTCDTHRAQIENICEAMGLHVQFIPIGAEVTGPGE